MSRQPSIDTGSVYARREVANDERSNPHRSIGEALPWTRGWRTAYSEAWPEDERHDVSYDMKRKDYERLKNSSVRVQIELALSQYVEDQPRVLVLSTAPFSDEKLGTCRINPPSASYLECLKPF